MAVTTNHTNLEFQQWSARVYREWRRGNLFSPYMGEGPTSIINVHGDLRGDRGAGDVLNIPFVGRLKGPGVSTGPLVGNEEKMDSYGARLWIDWSRNAILLRKDILRRSTFDQLEFVRPLLTEWGKGNQRDEIVHAFDALPSENPPTNLGNDTVGGQRVNGILYGSATAAQRNTWHDANSDRILYGSANNNFVTGNHATSLANIANTETASAAQLMLLKAKARKADPGITPYTSDDGRENFVLFAGSNAFRDYSKDPSIEQANRDARPREGNGMAKNPLFQDGDLLYRGVIIREVPEIDTLATKTGAGGGGINVAPVFFCGQSALAWAWGKMPAPTERKEDDYGLLLGRGVEMIYGVGKLSRKVGGTTALKQHGMVTGYVASIDDA